MVPPKAVTDVFGKQSAEINCVFWSAKPFHKRSVQTGLVLVFVANQWQLIFSGMLGRGYLRLGTGSSVGERECCGLGGGLGSQWLAWVLPPNFLYQPTYQPTHQPTYQPTYQPTNPTVEKS